MSCLISSEQMPWNVAIFTKSLVKSSRKFVCAGSLIHPKIVVATAHCVHEKSNNDLVVRAGKTSSSSTQEDRDVQTIIVHENFIFTNLYNKIVIIFFVNAMCSCDHYFRVYQRSSANKFSRRFA